MLNNRDMQLIALVNNEGVIEDVLYANFLMAEKGQLFVYSLGESMVVELLHFFSLVKQKKGLHHDIYAVEGQAYRIVGFQLHDAYLLSVAIYYEEVLINELMKLNSESVNRIRTIEKEKAKASWQRNSDMYEEITHLNNELVNAQRLITKINGELSQKNKLLQEASFRDHLTNLYNRLYLKTKFQELASLQARHQYPITIVMIDLNNFKEVNDTFGHDKGDELLVTFAEEGKRLVRENYDYFFRLGGDEFLIIMVDCVIEDALKVCERLDLTFRNYTDISSLAYGAVALDVNVQNELEYYIIEADKRMYANKSKKKREDNSLDFLV